MGADPNQLNTVPITGTNVAINLDGLKTAAFWFMVGLIAGMYLTKAKKI